MRRRRRNSVWSFLPSASTPSTHRTYTQLKEDPLAKFNMTLLHTRKRKRRRPLWVGTCALRVCSAMALSWFRFSWVPLGAWLRDRKKLTAVNSIKREKEKTRKRHYLMTKKLERIKYGPKSYKEREGEIVILKYWRYPLFIRLSFSVLSSMSVVSGFTTK